MACVKGKEASVERPRRRAAAAQAEAEAEAEAARISSPLIPTS